MKPTIAFGPVRSLTSWKWVGEDIARELEKYYNVRTFLLGEAIPPCSVALLISTFSNDPCPSKVYVPIDHYKSANQIQLESHILKECDAVLTHSESLRPLLAQHCPRVDFVEHHNRYGLGSMAPFKRDGFVLYVGHPQNLPFFFEKMQRYALPRPLLVLSEDVEAIKEASTLSPDVVFEGQLWTEESQKVAMVRASAALDLKGDTFEQIHKPPTKGQKYIMSGIPFAVNQGNYVYEYFERKGLRLAEPHEERWFSEEYWKETREFGEKLRQELTLEAVALKYRQVIDSLL